MQYLVSVIYDKSNSATPDEHAAIDVFNDRLQAEDHWVFAGGLAAPATAMVIDNRVRRRCSADRRPGGGGRGLPPTFPPFGSWAWLRP